MFIAILFHHFVTIHKLSPKQYWERQMMKEVHCTVKEIRYMEYMNKKRGGHQPWQN